jgi:glycogen debranching enzyme
MLTGTDSPSIKPKLNGAGSTKDGKARMVPRFARIALASALVPLCEVQAHVYGAKRATARIAARFEPTQLARKFDREAAVIREQFEHQFWDGDLSLYALALDREKGPCRVGSSNAGHGPLASIVSQEHASRLSKILFRESLFFGMGRSQDRERTCKRGV